MKILPKLQEENEYSSASYQASNINRLSILFFFLLSNNFKGIEDFRQY